MSDPRPVGRLEITPEVERMTVGAGTSIQRRADAPVEAKPLGGVPVTPKLLLCCAYLDAFAKKGWNAERAYDTCRALGFKPQELADARAVLRARAS